MKNFENSLDTMLEKAFLTISNGVDDAKSYFHTPTVCTFEGQDISARTVVLRDFDAQERVLRFHTCLLYTSPSPRDMRRSRMPSSA